MKTGLMQSVDGPQSDQQRADMVFSGQIVVYRQVTAMAKLVNHLRSAVITGFEPHDPVTAEAFLDTESFRKTSMALRKKVADDLKTAELFRSVFAAVGCDLSALYWDHLKLRFQPSDPALHTKYMRDLPAHRDTWGSNILAQINWWAPVWPVTEDRTMTVFPEYWDHPIENDTADWSYHEFHRRRAENPNTSYPMLPTCRVEPDVTKGIPLLVDPGDIVAFSGAHLHASVPNRSGMTRISMETRTVSLHDLKQNRRAPNLDGAAKGIRTNWFTQVSLGTSLSDSGISIS